MLIPREVFKMANLLKGNNGLDTIPGIIFRRKNDNFIQAITCINGHYTFCVEWFDPDNHNYPMLSEVTNMDVNPEAVIFIPKELISKFKIPSKSHYPILNHLFVQEYAFDEKYTMGYTDLEFPTVFKTDLPDEEMSMRIETVLNWFDNREEEEYDTNTTCIRANPSYLADIIKTMVDVRGENKNSLNSVVMTSNNNIIKIVMDSNSSNTVATAYLMAILK